MDQSTSHKTSQVNAAAKKKKVNIVLFPPNMTKLLQPADVAWFRSMKSGYHQKWNDWFLKSKKAFTKQGNLKSPGYQTVVKWISEIWRDLDENLIRNSFDQTGITSSVNDNFHTVLRYVIENNDLPITVLDDVNAGDQVVDGFGSDSESLTDNEGDEESESEDDEESESEDDEESDSEDDEESDNEEESEDEYETIDDISDESSLDGEEESDDEYETIDDDDEDSGVDQDVAPNEESNEDSDKSVDESSDDSGDDSGEDSGDESEDKCEDSGQESIADSGEEQISDDENDDHIKYMLSKHIY